MSEEKRFDIMMGVGQRYYPDPSYFIDEVLRLGLSKRVAQCPKYFSGRVWLVHWRTRRFFAMVDGAECRKVTAADAASEALRGCGTLKPGKEYVRGRRR